MKKRFPIVLLLFIVACDQPSDRKIANNKNTDTSNAPNISYSLINARTDNGGQFYDIYLNDTSKIAVLNSYLKDKYGNASGWIQINYFNDSGVAKTYFDKQLDNNVSDKEKDTLFRFYIANYKYNPATKYDTLVFEH